MNVQQVFHSYPEMHCKVYTNLFKYSALSNYSWKWVQPNVVIMLSNKLNLKIIIKTESNIFQSG